MPPLAGPWCGDKGLGYRKRLPLASPDRRCAHALQSAAHAPAHGRDSCVRAACRDRDRLQAGSRALPESRRQPGPSMVPGTRHRENQPIQSLLPDPTDANLWDWDARLFHDEGTCLSGPITLDAAASSGRADRRRAKSDQSHHEAADNPGRGMRRSAHLARSLGCIAVADGALRTASFLHGEHEVSWNSYRALWGSPY
jgi:hypothetical protein